MTATAWERAGKDDGQLRETREEESKRSMAEGEEETNRGGKREQQRDKYVHEGVFLLQISSSCNLIL